MNATATTLQTSWLERATALLRPVGRGLDFPVLLALGLGGRFAALVLFAFNINAVVSYPDLNPVGLEQHYVWGLLLVLVLHGPGKLSADHLLGRRLGW